MRSRRDFLKLLLAAPIAATVDVEKLLWVPRPMVTVPAMPSILPMTLTDFHQLIWKDVPLLEYIRVHNEARSKLAELMGLAAVKPFIGYASDGEYWYKPSKGVAAIHMPNR